MLLELDNVELYFKNKRILNGIYLKAETGNVTAILGSNGCGKSCLLNIAFGNLKTKYSLLRLDGKPLLKPLYKTGFVKYLPQFHFFPNTIKLAFAFKLYNADWLNFQQQFPEFLKYKYSKFQNLSGGERRLIETYIIIKSKSKIVFLDEPFSNLSPIYIDTIKQWITEEKQHKAIVITDHMYRHVIDTADTIYLLKNGCTKLIDNLSELEDYRYLSKLSLNE